MAILFSDGFDNNVPQFSNKYDTYTGTSSHSSALARTGVAALMKNGYATKNLSSNYSTLVVGFAYRLFFLTYNKTILKLIDDSTNQIYLYFNSSSDKIQVKRGDGTTLGTSTTSMSIDDWNYIELKVTISNSGSFELRINGNTEASGSVDTQNTANSYVNKVAIGNDETNFNDLFDDYYIDSSDFLGPLNIYTIRPTSNSSVSWTPNPAGLNYQNLDDNLYQDGDLTYVSATSTNLKDLYGLEDISIANGEIKGIVHNFTAKKTDSNPTDIQPIIKVNGVEYSGTTQSMTTDYSNYQTIWTNNPDNSLSWTENDINSLLSGIKTI